MDVARVLQLVRPFFEDRRQPFAVVGGLALLAHGAARATFDVDLLAPRSVRDDLVRFLEEDVRALGAARRLPATLDRDAAIRFMRDASLLVDRAVRRRPLLDGAPFQLPGHRERGGDPPLP